MQELATVTFQAYASFIFFFLFISLATKPKVIKSLGALPFDNTPLPLMRKAEMPCIVETLLRMNSWKEQAKHCCTSDV